MNNILTFLKLDKNKILLMLQREEQIRFSKDYINKCSKVAHIPNAWLEITDKMQKDLVKEFGYIDKLSNTLAVNVLRKAIYIYPNDHEIKNSVVHFRENIAKQGTYNVGDLVKDINLHTINFHKTNLFSLLNQNKTNIMLVGSHT